VEATDILKEEHRVIERVLDSLETAAGRLRAGDAIGGVYFVEAAEFVKGFADGCHHMKEEGVLFPALEAAGVPNAGGPIGVMLAEHAEGRRLTQAMRAAAERLDAGQADQAAVVAQNALAYVALLRQHIAKEDGVLFPMADRVIPPEQRAEITTAFDHIEHVETGEGVHEKYLALADRLEAGARP
jgi:hemerythrin-like domain-containing protein